MAGVLYGVRPLDPLTFAAVSALLGAIACSPVTCPHRGAARVDPMIALKDQ